MIYLLLSILSAPVPRARLALRKEKKMKVKVKKIFLNTLKVVGPAVLLGVMLVLCPHDFDPDFDPDSDDAQDFHVSTEVGRPEPIIDTAPLFPPCSEFIHPDAPCDETRRVATVSKSDDMKELVLCLQ